MERFFRSANAILACRADFEKIELVYTKDLTAAHECLVGEWNPFSKAPF